MEIKEKLGDKKKVTGLMAELTEGDEMELICISFTWYGKNGVVEEQKFRKAKLEEEQE